MAVQPLHTQLQPSIHRLPNGLTIVLEHLPHVHSSSIGVWVRTGSANETAKQAGISHFLEHLFFKGTTTRSPRELMHAIESRGGQMNAFTSREYTCLYVKSLTAHLPVGIEILADVLKNAVYADLEKERNVILEEIAASMDVPEEYAHDVLTEAFWPNHALGRPIAGSLESVSGITFDDVVQYKEYWYRPENLVIAVAGNFDEALVQRQLEDAFGDIAAGTVDGRIDRAEHAAGVEIAERDIGQHHLAFAFPSAGIADDERYAYEMLASTLGGGSTSRLFDRIREEEGLAYSIYAFNASYLHTGMLGVYAAIAPENFEKTLALCEEELRKLQDTPIPDEELFSNHEQLKGGLLLALENTFNRMARMARSVMYYDRVQTVEELLGAVDAVTAADLQRLAQHVFRPDRCLLTVVGPKPPGNVRVPAPAA